METNRLWVSLEDGIQVGRGIENRPVGMRDNRTRNQARIIRRGTIGDRRNLYANRCLRDAAFLFVIISERCHGKSVLLNRRLHFAWRTWRCSLAKLCFLDFTERHRCGPRFAIAKVVDIHLAARCGAANRIAKGDFIDDRRTTDLCDHIASLNPALIRRAADNHFFDVGAGGCTHNPTFIRGDVLRDQTKRAAGDLTFGDQLVGDIFRGVGWNCIADTHTRAGWGVDCDIDADQLALDIEQRSTRVPTVDRRICLNEGWIKASRDTI